MGVFSSGGIEILTNLIQVYGLIHLLINTQMLEKNYKKYLCIIIIMKDLFIIFMYLFYCRKSRI